MGYRQTLIDNLNKIHTTYLGEQRIKKNLEINCNVIEYCKTKLLGKNSKIYKLGKNFYCVTENIKITINSFSYSIITAHKINKIDNK